MSPPDLDIPVFKNLSNRTVWYMRNLISMLPSGFEDIFCFKWMWYNNFYNWLANGHNVTNIAHCKHRLCADATDHIQVSTKEYLLFFWQYVFNSCQTMSQALTKFQKTSLMRKKIMLCCLMWEEKQKKEKKTQNLKIQLLQLHIDIIWSNNSKQFTMLLHFTTIFIHILRLLLLLLQVV